MNEISFPHNFFSFRELLGFSCNSRVRSYHQRRPFGEVNGLICSMIRTIRSGPGYSSGRRKFASPIYIIILLHSGQIIRRSSVRADKEAISIESARVFSRLKKSIPASSPARIMILLHRRDHHVSEDVHMPEGRRKLNKGCENFF